MPAIGLVHTSRMTLSCIAEPLLKMMGTAVDARQRPTLVVTVRWRLGEEGRKEALRLGWTDRGNLSVQGVGVA